MCYYAAVCYYNKKWTSVNILKKFEGEMIIKLAIECTDVMDQFYNLRRRKKTLLPSCNDVLFVRKQVRIIFSHVLNECHNKNEIVKLDE